jgi:hypothetical protein
MFVLLNLGSAVTSARAGGPADLSTVRFERTVRLDRVTPYFCAIGLQARFSGRKNTVTHVISGSWSYSASTSCSYPMLRLDLQLATLLGSKTLESTPPVTCRLCAGQGMAGFFSCSRCNGTWTFRSDHTILLPAASLLVSMPPGCQKTATTIHCTAQIISRLA